MVVALSYGKSSLTSISQFHYLFDVYSCPREVSLQNPAYPDLIETNWVDGLIILAPLANHLRP
jgi:hypothetical protein